ncbi:transposase [Lacticaseibacillus paracasei]|nr:transposase [Lacticaseibacillus paracasei]
MLPNSPATIYNWLNQGRIGFSLNDLPEHGVRQRRNVDQRSKYNPSIFKSSATMITNS